MRNRLSLLLAALVLGGCAPSVAPTTKNAFDLDSAQAKAILAHGPIARPTH